MQWTFKTIMCTLILAFSLNGFAAQQPSDSLRLWLSQGEYLEFEHQSIYYRDSLAIDESEGRHSDSSSVKPTLVLLHGFPTASWDWHSLWQSLNDSFRLVTLDFIGFGFSAKPESGYSIARQADLVEQLLDHLGVSAAHFLVHDYGTYVAQELLARQQSSQQAENRFTIQSLAMLNGVVYPQGLQLRPIQKALNSPFGWFVSRFASFDRFSKNFSSVFGKYSQPNRLALQDYWYLITLQDGHRIGHKLIHYYDESLANSTRWVAALSNSNVPIMLITGLADPVAGKPMVDKFEQLLPGRPVHVLENVGHYPHLEDEERVALLYRAFVHGI